MSLDEVLGATKDTDLEHISSILLRVFQRIEKQLREREINVRQEDSQAVAT